MDFGKQSHYNVVLNLGHTGEHTQPETSRKKTPTDSPHRDSSEAEREPGVVYVEDCISS